MAWSREEFLKRLQEKRASYHLEHPFEKELRSGQLSRDQIKFWIANRFYYQFNLPRKDAAIIANCDDLRVRRAWLRRLIDQEGDDRDAGGIESWVEFSEACGLSRQRLLGFDHLVPAVKFAVDAYVNFAKQAPWQEAVCSSLTEMFASDAHRSRIEAFETHYSWLPVEKLSYFHRRLDQVRRDVDQGLSLTLDYFDTAEKQRRAVEILKFKLDVLWAMADGIYHSPKFKGGIQ